MDFRAVFLLREFVALLAEGVDRNALREDGDVAQDTSPSSRRAWIEIQICSALIMMFWSRPPRGGRG